MAQIESIVLGGGCFWCTEAIFQEVKGVIKVTSGYAGGMMANPLYEHVASGVSGHAEVIKVDFDPAQINLEKLLEIFFAVHDPTSLNRQGYDAGEQYRSVIFWLTEEQKEVAERAVRTASRQYTEPIVTEVKPLHKFYPAEVEHQNYFKNNPGKPYCSVVIAPKLRKFREQFK
ncbi:peptide-methionine (S)-S-oxide reductase MsrA [Candidatus Falkowbacteria bacterium]|nr:peptide-methionine (S)-S-oxide reductase MsrA [Candidatus Falkowbacteria bacterium]